MSFSHARTLPAPAPLFARPPISPKMGALFVVALSAVLFFATSAHAQTFRARGVKAQADSAVSALTPGEIITFAGGGNVAGPVFTGQPATSVQFTDPYTDYSFGFGLAMDAAGSIYFTVDQTVVKVDSSGNITTVAGNGTQGNSGDGGPALNAQFIEPQGLAIDAAGNLYVADDGDGAGSNANVIRKIDAATGVITTFAGAGPAGFSGDGGPATAAQFNGMSGLAFDNNGNLYVADTGNSRIRMIDSAGVVTTVAGVGVPNGNPGGTGDGGPATSAHLGFPEAIAIDATGNLYIADTQDERIRKVDTSGVITTVAGNGYFAPDGVSGGYSGDGGPATAAEINFPEGIAVDGAGNIYIADSFNHRIRMVNTAGIINTIAGDGTYGYTGDGGAATQAELIGPGAVLLDSAGHLYLADIYQTGLPNVVRVMSVPGFVVTPLDFTLATTSSNSATIAAGGSTNYTFNLMPTLNAFPGTVTFSVAGLPAGATASFSPSTLPANSPGGTVTMTVATAATAKQTSPWFNKTTGSVALGMLLLPMAKLRRRKRIFYSMIPVILLGVMTGCGGSSSTSGSGGSKDMTSTITVTATSGTVTHTATVTLIVN